MLLAKDDRVGAFQVTGVLGKGGMGEVYRARDTRLNRDVALKVLPASLAQDPERMARFEREAQLLASLNHANIATLYGMEESGAVRALVMELVEGQTLADVIEQGRIPPEEAIPLALQIAEAVEYAHGHGVVHRDLKPANVKVSPENTVKVLDFGLAKALAGEHESGTDPHDSMTRTMGATATGAIMGTASYMSPEQVKGKRADRRSDIWAFGVVLAEMLIGGHLYRGETGVEVMAAVVRDAPPLDRLPKDTPLALRRLIERCLEKDPLQRLQHIGEARIALQKKDLTMDASPATAAVVKRSRAWPWIAATVTAVAALAGLAYVHFGETPSAPRNIRFQIHPPGKSSFSVFRLSPDGRNLVFIAGNRLWVRALDTLEAKELAGTEGATYPFWSPDSANIGFFAQGKLKRIALAGGPAVTLCDAVSGRGGTWNREGTIVFSPNLANPLERVAEAGGVPQPASRFQAKGAAESHRFPEFLPDGRHFLFLGSGAQEDTGIFVGTLDQMETKRLSEDLSNAIYSPPVGGGPGHLLFRRETTLMARPFNPDTLEFTGDVFPLAESVGNVANAGYGGFSVSDGGILAVGSSAGAKSQAVWWDRSGKRLEAVTQPAAIAGGGFSLSPDERKLAFAPGDNELREVWIQDLVRGTALRLTFGGWNLGPVWSMDGAKVAYAHREPLGYLTSLLEKSVSGEGAENALLRPAGLNASPYDWSRDGNFIAYRVDGEKTGYDVWLVPLSGDRKAVAFLQTPAREASARFSPDSKLVAYDSDESGQAQVYVQPVSKNGSKWQISTAGGSNPNWRRDGTEMYYVAPNRMLMAVPVKLAPSFEVGKPQVLFELATDTYVARGDGQRFLVVVPSADAPDAPPITVMTNWAAGVGK